MSLSARVRTGPTAAHSSTSAQAPSSTTATVAALEVTVDTRSRSAAIGSGGECCPTSSGPPGSAAICALGDPPLTQTLPPLYHTPYTQPPPPHTHTQREREREREREKADNPMTTATTTAKPNSACMTRQSPSPKPRRARAPLQRRPSLFQLAPYIPTSRSCMPTSTLRKCIAAAWTSRTAPNRFWSTALRTTAA